MATQEERLKLGFQYLKEQRWWKLISLAEEILYNDYKCFYGYCFKMCGELEQDIIHNSTKVAYIIEGEQLDYDIKTRLYHFARKKYCYASKNVTDTLNSLYPDDEDEEKHKHKGVSYYDLRYRFFNTMLVKIDYVNGKYLIDLEKYADDNEKQAIVKRYKKWIENIKFAHSELERYNKDIGSFLYADYKATPSPGNKKLFAINLTIEIFTILFSIWNIVLSLLALYYTDKGTRTTSGVVAVINAILLIIMSFIFCKTFNLFKKHKVLAWAAIIGMVALSCMGIVTTISSKVPLGKMWFFVAGAILFFLMSLDFAFSVAKYMPHRKKKTMKPTYIGDLKSLLKDDVYVSYSFAWNVENKKTKKEDLENKQE